jgi:hypothetical protein
LATLRSFAKSLAASALNQPRQLGLRLRRAVPSRLGCSTPVFSLLESTVARCHANHAKKARQDWQDKDLEQRFEKP